MHKKKVAFLTGAGVSAESGIDTFRAKDGLWANCRIEDVATPEGWEKNPDLVTEFYNLRRKQVISAFPNEAHIAIASLEIDFDVTIITQNIDDLHERAGSSKIIHLHGQIRKSKSSGPNSEKAYFDIPGFNLTKAAVCPDGFRLRPHVVWFGEDVPLLEKAVEVISEADIVVVVGTSLQVYPAAQLIEYAKKNALCYIIDPEQISYANRFNFKPILKTATEGMIELKNLLSNL